MKKKRRYAAKLLYTFKVDSPKFSRQRHRICEEKVINFCASSNDQAYEMVKPLALAFEYSYENDEKQNVDYVFLGIIDIKDLTDLSEDNEVWYNVFDTYSIKKTIAELIPQDSAQYEIFR